MVLTAPVRLGIESRIATGPANESDVGALDGRFVALARHATRKRSRRINMDHDVLARVSVRTSLRCEAIGLDVQVEGEARSERDGERTRCVRRGPRDQLLASKLVAIEATHLSCL